MKKLFKLTGVFLLIVIILVSVFLYIQINRPYTEIIDVNWSIKLPDSYKEIYSMESIASVHGDGERYHIFEYTKEEEISQSLNWESNKDKSVEAEIDKVLSGLNVPKENRPNFQSDYKYYIEKKDHDSSKLYIIFITGTKKLYVIEDIL